MATNNSSGRIEVPEAKEAMDRFKMEVASELGISQAQVSRLEKSALSHMKKHI